MAELAKLLCAGTALGALFFGGLWLTVRYGLRGQRPALMLLASLLIRMLLLCAGLYYLRPGTWQGWLAILAGLLLARVVLTRHAGATAVHAGSNPNAP
jgi:F1F0 ATPase subunit 2